MFKTCYAVSPIQTNSRAPVHFNQPINQRAEIKELQRSRYGSTRNSCKPKMVQLQPTAKGEATTKQVPCGANCLNRSVSNELILHLMACGDRARWILWLFFYLPTSSNSWFTSASTGTHLKTKTKSCLSKASPSSSYHHHIIIIRERIMPWQTPISELV